jgi:hypothetical protein
MLLVSAGAHDWHPGIEKKNGITEHQLLKYTITLEDGRVRPKHVVSTNNKKVNDLVTLMDNKEQTLSVKRM